MFGTVGELLKREYPNVPKKQLHTAAYTVTILIDRSPMLEWLGVKGSPIQSAKAAIEKVLADLS